ncbi:MAG: O-antigen ligase family protein [Bdellovibrionales bacterium]
MTSVPSSAHDYAPHIPGSPHSSTPSGASFSDYPKLPPIQAIPSVALSTFALAYAGIFGMYPILIFYALWLPRLIYKGRLVLLPLKGTILPLVFVTFCIVSVLWSDYRHITLRAAIQLASMIVCSIIIARLVSTECFIKGIIIGSCMVLAYTLADGVYGRDYFTGEMALAGKIGSKNQVGFFAEIGLIAAIILFFWKSGPAQKFIFSIVPIILCAVCLYKSRSATSLATLVLTLGVCYGAYRITKFPPSRRMAALIVMIIFAIIVGCLGYYLGHEETILKALGKNSTLTGRTYLWDEGIKNGLKDPWFGHGYYAFWVIGRQEAERYWFEFQMYNRSGFHFHSLFIQTFVDLGMAGLALMIFLIVLGGVKSLRYLVLHGGTLKGFFCMGIIGMLAARAFVEVDFLGPYGIGCLLFYFIIPHLTLAETGGRKAPDKPLHPALIRNRPA